MKTSAHHQNHEVYEALLVILSDLAKAMNQKKQTRELYYDNADMMKLFKTSASTLYRLRKNKQVTFFKLGKKIHYPAEEISRIFGDQSDR